VDEHARVTAIVSALLGDGDIALAPGVDAESPGRAWQAAGQPFRERDLANLLRKGTPPAIVVVAEASPTLARALRESPPPLLVWLGDAPDPALQRDLSARSLWLGPGATLHCGGQPDRFIAVGHCAQELEGLRRALRALPGARERVFLSLSPTPSWLPSLLSEPRLRDAQAIGTVSAEQLHTDWIAWARAHDHHVLVPVGVETVDLDDPHRLVPNAAAQALEHRTGPVFPSPRVIAAVGQALAQAQPPAPRQTPTPAALAVWTQARRALPAIGGLPEMDAPLQSTDLDAPASAFLAQAALLRARARREALAIDVPHPTIDEPGVERAMEVLRAAGEQLTDHESKVVLRGFGLEVTRQAVANSASGASGFADRIGYPVVLKALSPDLRRRSDVGGVILALETSAAVRRAYASIVDNIERRAPTAALHGVLVAEMIPDGPDLRCGARRLPSGERVLHARAVAPGAPPEVALALCPLDPRSALELAFSVLRGSPVPAWRREDDPDLGALATLFLRLGILLARTGDRITSLDLGPVRWSGASRGYVTLDAAITQRPHLQGT